MLLSEGLHGKIPYPTNVSYVLHFIALVLVIVSFTGNSLFLVSNIRNNHDPSVYLLLSLSFADMLLTLSSAAVGIPILFQNGYQLGHGYCVVSYYLTLLASTCSVIYRKFLVSREQYSK